MDGWNSPEKECRSCGVRKPKTPEFFKRCSPAREKSGKPKWKGFWPICTECVEAGVRKRFKPEVTYV